MRTLLVRSGILVAAALAVAACGGTATPTVPPVNVPSIAIPSIAIPSIPPILLPSGALPSIAIPSFAFPSFNTNADPALAARFPTQVAGQPVTNVQTVRFMDFLTLLGSDDQTTLTAFTQALTSIGVDPNTLTEGTATATVNGNSVQFEAIHMPGADANRFIQIWPQVTVLFSPEDQPPTLGQASIGGKNVSTLTDPSTGDVSYLYANGDVVWSVSSAAAQAEVAAVLTALP
ncbi:MAG TPA: hypothetical protein VIK08_09500 [Candidatus Limnocylindrales bacterium]